MTRFLFTALLAALLAGCTTTFGPGGSTSYTPNASTDSKTGWYDGSGPRGASGGGP